MHIGVIEDNPSIVELLIDTLSLQGHTISVHPNGVDFLQCACASPDGQALFPYDLLILDLGLPGGLSGEDILERLELQFDGQTLPVIVLTAAGAEVLRRVEARFPTVPVLTKPVRLDKLLQTVSATLRKTGAA